MASASKLLLPGTPRGTLTERTLTYPSGMWTGANQYGSGSMEFIDALEDCYV